MLIHQESIKAVHIRYGIALMISLQIILLTVSYSVSVSLKKMKYPYLYLSASIDKDPVRSLACVLGPIIAILSGFVLLMRSVLLRPFIVTTSQLRLWRIFSISSIVICFALIAVPAIPHSLNAWLHMTAAFLLFSSGLLIVLSSFWLDITLALPTSRLLLKLRLVCLCLTILGAIGFAVCYFFIPLLSSIFEILAAASMNTYICTFAYTCDVIPANKHNIQNSFSDLISKACTEEVSVGP